jgi:hypothetical protein
MTMTQTDTRNTQKTGFINNTSYTYTAALVSDYTNPAKGATSINTLIDYNQFHTTLYVVLKLETTTLEYALADHPNIYSSYNYTSPTGVMTTKIRINLPTVPDINGNPVQASIPYAGQWTVTLYNTREEQRQSLSKVLKPEADL